MWNTDSYGLAQQLVVIDHARYRDPRRTEPLFTRAGVMPLRLLRAWSLRFLAFRGTLYSKSLL